MVRRPQSIDEAKQIYSEEKGKVLRSLDALIGSRVLMAVLATFVLAFAVNLWMSPNQMPNVGGLSLATYGLPPNVDFGFLGEQYDTAKQAAYEQGLDGEVRSFLDGNRGLVPIINGILFGASVVLLLWNMGVMTRRRRFTKG